VQFRTTGVIGATAALLLAAALALSAHAGKLDSFEDSVRMPSQEPPHSQHCAHDDLGDACIDALFTDLFGDVLAGAGATIAAGGIASVERLGPGIGTMGLSVRRNGEPLIPYLAIEPAWQMLRSDVEAWDLQIEFGWGPFAVLGRCTRFREETPDDTMYLSRASVLYRMSAGDFMEVDFGFGTMFLNGEAELHRFSFSMPVRLHPGGPVGIEFRPAWSDNLADYDVSLYVTVGNVSLKGGYRWLNAPGDSLNGPCVGLSLRL
jgi:hypothetical protein